MLKSRRRPRAVASAAEEDTRTRILDTAERLFAERGIEAVSVRAILGEAGLNVALAHYHFGSRDGLIAELLRSRISPLVKELLGALARVDARGAEASLEDVLRAWFTPLARWLAGAPRFARILAQLHASPSLDVRALGRESLREAVQRLGEAVVKRLPGDTDPKRLFLRFYLVVGGPSFLAGMWDHVQQSARRHLGADAVLEAEWVAEELVAFSAAGLRAGAERRRS
jgi:AcrR family transcriptional regulator